MTRRLLFVGLAACAAAGAQSRFGPVLVKASALFHTNNEDKDWDTALFVYVNRGRNVIARVENVQGHYNDNSDNLVNLPVLIPATLDECQQGCSVTVSIRPNGHDTWKFNLEVNLFFSDSQHIVRPFANIKLDENNREFRNAW